MAKKLNQKISILTENKTNYSGKRHLLKIKCLYSIYASGVA